MVQVNCFRAIIATTPEDLLPTVYLCTNQVAPSHEGMELGIGDATLIKVHRPSSYTLPFMCAQAHLRHSNFVEALLATELRKRARSCCLQSAALCIQCIANCFACTQKLPSGHAW